MNVNEFLIITTAVQGDWPYSPEWHIALKGPPNFNSFNSTNFKAALDVHFNLLFLIKNTNFKGMGKQTVGIFSGSRPP